VCCVSQGFVALEPELVNVTVMGPSAAAPAGAQLPLPAAGSARQPAHTGIECEFHCLATAGVDSVVMPLGSVSFNVLEAGRQEAELQNQEAAAVA